MAKSTVLQSNLIVRTTLPRPAGSGFKSILTDLERINKLTKDLNNRKVTIRVDLRGGQQAISVLQQTIQALKLQAKVQKQNAQAAQQAATTQAAAAQQATAQAKAAVAAQGPGAFVKSVTTTKPDKDGNLIRTQVNEAARQAGALNIRSAVATNLSTGQFIGSTDTTRDVVALAREAAEKRKAASRVTKAEAQDRQRETLRLNKQAGQRFIQDSAKQGLTQVTKLGKQVSFASTPLKTFNANLITVSRTLADGTTQFRTYNEATNKYTPLTTKATDASKKFNQEAAKRVQVAQRLKALQQAATRGENIARGLQGRGFAEQAPVTTRGPLAGAPGRTATTNIRTFTRQLADGRTQVLQFNEATNKARASILKNTAAAKEAAQIQRIANNQVRAAAQVQSLLAQGYKVHNVAQKTFMIGTQQITTSLTNLRRLTGSPLLGNFTAQVAQVNSATGAMNKNVLSGIDAMRLIGNTFTTAAAKVSTFLGATAAVILVFRGFAFAISTMKELEKNTVFMARVGSGLGKNFVERLSESEKLTQSLIEQSYAMGANATEAQRASSVFLRLGQNREKALKSTRVALIASRIAELEVEDAAKLLSAATSQFNLEAEQLLPTLDSLNTLSNNYRVTTDDLLQSISRSGSVFATNNGTLEQLAATTAVVSQVTARTGAEIGNALKTIQSRLSAPEVITDLFKKTGISMRDSRGQTKNLVEVMLQLQLALERVNAADKARLGVVVAGARQVNILRNAVDNVIDIVLAESRALQDASSGADDYGSATEELIDTSRTLESVMLRLRGAFVELFATSEGALTGAFKAISGTLIGLLKLIGKFDGLIIKIGLGLLIFALARIALIRLGAAAAFASFQAARAAGTMGVLAIATHGLSAATGTLAAVFTGLNLAAGAVGAAFIVLMLIVSSLEQRSAEAAIANDEFTDSLDRSISILERRSTATKELVNAMFEQLAAQRQLNKETAAGGKGNKNLEDQIQKNIKKLASPDRGGLGIDIPRGGVKTEAQIRQVQRQLIAENRKSNEGKLKGLTLRIGGLTEELKAKEDDLSIVKSALDRQKRRKSELSRGHEIIESFGVKRPGPKFDKNFVAQQLAATEKEIKKLNEEFFKSELAVEEAKEKIQELSLEADKLKDTLAALPESFIDTFLKAQDAADESIGRLEVLNNLKETFDDFSFEIPQLTKRDAQNNLRKYSAEVDVLAEQLTILKNQTDLKSLEEYFKNAADSAERFTKIDIESQVNEIKELSEFFSQRSEVSGSFFSMLQKQQSRMSFINDPSKFGGAKLSRFKEITDEINILRTEANELQNDLLDIKFTNPREKVAFTQATQSRISDLLGKARDLEVQKAQELLDVEFSITEEKIKQNKETLKALGLLSDEDKVRVIQQAQFFRDNPNAKISATQKFLASSEANKIWDDFFGKFMEQKFTDDTPLGKLLGGVTGPENQDNDQALAKLDEIMKDAGGREAFMKQQQRKALGNLRLQSKVGGKATPGEFPDADFADKAVGLADVLDVTVSLKDVDFKPLIDTFEKITVIEMENLRRDMISRIEDIWMRVKRIPGSDQKIPGRIPRYGK